jgi:DNA-binding MarR family transcriptional regulator
MLRYLHHEQESDTMSSPEPLARAVHALIAGSVATHEAVADGLGINSTDLRCLGLATTEPGLTPTRLAELARLTTGAITGVLDRLERAGFVRRETDPADRRRLRVQLVPDRLGELGEYYGPLIASSIDLAAGWDPDTRARLADYLEGFAASLHEQADRLRVAARGGLVGNTYTAPLGDVTHARLVFVSGAPRLSFGGSALGQQVRVVAEAAASTLRLGSGSGPDELVRIVFDGPTPDVRVVNGTVTVRYSRRLLDVRGRVAEIALNPAPAWSVEVDGGVTSLEGDLRAVRLAGLEVRGGANHLALRLGAPDGAARVVLAGGTSAARFDRPRGVPAALQVRGGVSRLRFDGRRVEGVSGNLRLQTDDFADAGDRYEIELSGGASDLVIGAA